MTADPEPLMRPGTCETYEHLQEAVRNAGTALAYLGLYREQDEPDALKAARKAFARMDAELDHVRTWLGDATGTPTARKD